MAKTTDWVIREQERAGAFPGPDDSDYDAPPAPDGWDLWHDEPIPFVPATTAATEEF